MAMVVPYIGGHGVHGGTLVVRALFGRTRGYAPTVVVSVGAYPVYARIVQCFVVIVPQSTPVSFNVLLLLYPVYARTFLFPFLYAKSKSAYLLAEAVVFAVGVG